MSQDVERVYTVNLGKVLLSPDNQRSKRAVNMIKEFARHHMKVEQVKLEEDVSHLIWSRGIKHPPRKIRVRMTRTDEGYILVSKYEGEEEVIEKTEKEAKEHISYLRNFSQGTMPINILVNKNEEDIYKKVMKKMRKVSNLSIKVRD